MSHHYMEYEEEERVVYVYKRSKNRTSKEILKDNKIHLSDLKKELNYVEKNIKKYQLQKKNILRKKTTLEKKIKNREKIIKG